LFCTG
jgi:hypothetical protein